jgi:hypothetical protein
MTDLVPANNGSTSLTPFYDQMRVAIDTAHSMDEVTVIRIEAQRAEAYARMAADYEGERKCREIRIRAERKCGEILAAMQRSKGGRPSNKNSGNVGPSFQDQREQIGVTDKKAKTYQKLASIPEDTFNELLTAPGAPPTPHGIIAADEATRTPPVKLMDKVDPRALWLWGRLLDFEREGLLDMKPKAALETMLDHMRTTTLEMAPRVADWLKELCDG